MKNWYQVLSIRPAIRLTRPDLRFQITPQLIS